MESLLLISDVHLGSDLNDVGHAIRRSRQVDEDLVHLLDHYRSVAPPGDRWRLVVAGDFIDFVGMAVRAEGADLETERSDEERDHGLGNAVDHVRVKLQLVAERHANVFDALARFVADGHSLAFVHGNHDIEMHWRAVKEDLRALLLARARASQVAPIDGPAFDGRIEFHAWFFHVEGLAYIEHGHQYDALCASQYVLAPLSAVDPRRLARSASDVLLRFVVRPTRGMHEYGHEDHGVSHYLGFAAKLGLRGLLLLGRRYAGAVRELFRLRREQLSGASSVLRAEHERAMALLAQTTRIGADRMRALAALQVPRATRTVGGILATVLLDQLALGLAAVLGLLVVAVLAVVHVVQGWWLAPCFVAWFLGRRQLARHRMVDPEKRMIERAAALAKLFGAPFVVMGHTHAPGKRAVNGGRSTYINLGSWAEEEEGDGWDRSPERYRATRTHLVIHGGAEGPVAQLLAWEGQSGPQCFVPHGPAFARRPRRDRTAVLKRPLETPIGATDQ
jgi:UDP-2,3-diacylglucosamine pyrophosphatase LpxH